ncbi:MAG TPA: TonB-dependent receptor [Burkholderiales bacterium]|nr:TonB-dependent receptor [Burkholderiales bacterium]
MRTAAAALGLLASVAAQAQSPANPATAIEAPVVHVIGVRPVPGLGTPLRDIPNAVQSTDADEIRQRDALDVADHLARSFSGVSLNDSQSNPFQRDLAYRGFTASPLLGVPQGLAVFVDGVRVNEPFGDMVNWDLIPRNAIANLHLVSGANPAFGLNTLGGVLSIHTKSGFAFPGEAARLSGGSFGRQLLEGESGGHGERADYFAAVRALDERGWREHTPSRLRQGFVKAGWQDARTDLDISLALADNAMQGTQTLPSSMLDDPRRAYTWPDRTENQLAFLTVRASRFVSNDLLVSGTVYVRDLQQDAVASNVNGEAGPPAFNDRNLLGQRTTGALLQAVISRRSGEMAHELTLGAALEGASSDFVQQRQGAALSAERETVALEPFAEIGHVAARNSALGLYVIEQFAPSPSWTFSLSGRYNVATVQLRDRSGLRPALDGDHVFRRLNPAFGAAWNPNAALTVFASLSQGMRVPSPAELTCADPAAPCTLPNQFLADPPLSPVIARTAEAGVRLRTVHDALLSAALYRTVVSSDIQFVSSAGAVNAGFFQNTGSTLRQGFELAYRIRTAPLSFTAAYSYLQAQYLSAFSMPSPNNSARDAADEIRVERGNALPGIPRSQAKLLADWGFAPRASLGFGWTWFDRQYARGDENNRDVHGPLPGYGVAQFFVRYEPRRDWQLSLKVDNVFDRRYASYGVLGRNFFSGPGQSFDPANATSERFVSPGAPRAAWISVAYRQ